MAETINMAIIGVLSNNGMRAVSVFKNNSIHNIISINHIKNEACRTLEYIFDTILFFYLMRSWAVFHFVWSYSNQNGSRWPIFFGGGGEM